MKILLSEEQLRQGVEQLAREITEHYGHRPVTIIGILTGSVVLLADLIRQLDMPLRVGVIQARSYRGDTTTPGPLSVHADLLPEVADCDVLLVDDIFDSGQTLQRITGQLNALGPRSVRSVVLLRKARSRETAIEPDHVAFEIPDEFVVGFGLDYHDAYRNLPYLAVLEEAELD